MTEFVISLQNRNTNESLTSTISMFSQQLVHRMPEFSCGLFNFDLTLCLKVRRPQVACEFVD
jgi:hypothetical protein